MLRRLLTYAILLLSIGMSAQNYTINFEQAPVLPAIPNSAIKENVLKFSFNFPGINIHNVHTSKGEYAQLALPKAYRSGKIGNPQMQSIRKLIEIPQNTEVQVNVLSYTTQEYVLSDYGVVSKVLPYQSSQSKSENNADVAIQQDTVVYNTNAYLDQDLYEIQELGKLRGVPVAQLSINPITYNPVSNKIKVFNNIEIEIEYTVVGEPVKSKSSISDPVFKDLFKTLVAAPASVKSSFSVHEDMVSYPVKYLLVSPPEFIDSLQNFIAWKSRKGFEVVVGNTQLIGTTANDIKTWIHAQYNNVVEGEALPSYLLLVGDIAQLPASQLGEETFVETDLYYASVDGDMFPEMYYGRLPVQNINQLKNVLDKILYYEQYLFEDDSFLNDLTLIAGHDEEWNPKIASPTLNYGTSNYFNTANGFNNINAYTDNYTGCYSPDKIGVGLINYTAHCSQTTWGTPFLSTTSIGAMSNFGKYPLAIGNCCTSADFTIDECIGEAWLRKEKAGGIAYIGSVPDSFWYEDFYWSVGAHSPVDNEYPEVESCSMGVYDAPFVSNYSNVDALRFVGNLAVTEAVNNGFHTDVPAKYYWEAYHTLGDPSLSVFFTQGMDNTISHDKYCHPDSLFYIEAQANSYVALSSNNQILSTGYVGEEGYAYLSLNIAPSTDSIDLVVTQAQYKPVIKKVPVVTQDSSSIVFEIRDINNQAIPNALVQFNDTSIETSIDGKATFNAVYPDENKHYTISATDYLTVNDSLTVEYNDIDLKLNLYKSYGVDVVVKSNALALENVNVTVRDESYTTNADGSISINKLPEGPNHMNFAKSGYYPLDTLVNLESDNQLISVSLQEKPDVLFTLMDKSTPLTGILVTFGNQTLMTNGQGQVLFANMEIGTYNLSINDDAYFSHDTSYVIEENLNETIDLTAKPDVTFVCKYNDYLISNADVFLNGEKQVSDTNGEVVFYHTDTAKYLFEVQHKAFETYTDSIEINLDGVNKELELISKTFTIFFTVSSNNSLLANAIVTINGESKNTDMFGVAVFSNLSYVENLNYSIALDGYQTLEGTFLAIDNNKQIDIQLVPQTFDVQFQVKDSHGPINGATVEFFQESKTTNTNGMVLFTNLPALEDENFTVTGTSDYQEYAASLDVVKDTLVVIYLIKVDIQEHKGWEVKVYPNPVKSGLIHIEQSSFVSSHMELYDALGTLVLARSLNNTKQSVSVSHLTKGMYYLKLSSKNHSETIKLLVY